MWHVTRRLPRLFSWSPGGGSRTSGRNCTGRWIPVPFQWPPVPEAGWRFRTADGGLTRIATAQARRTLKVSQPAIPHFAGAPSAAGALCWPSPAPASPSLLLLLLTTEAGAGCVVTEGQERGLYVRRSHLGFMSNKGRSGSLTDLPEDR